MYSPIESSIAIYILRYIYRYSSFVQYPKRRVTHCTGIPLPLPSVLGLAKMLFEALSLESVNRLLNTVPEGSPLAEFGILGISLFLDDSLLAEFGILETSLSLDSSLLAEFGILETSFFLDGSLLAEFGVLESHCLWNLLVWALRSFLYWGVLYWGVWLI